MGIVVVGVLRTPNGKLKGGLATVPTVTLGGLAISVALERAEVSAAAVDQLARLRTLPKERAQRHASRPGHLAATHGQGRRVMKDLCPTLASSKPIWTPPQETPARKGE